MKIAKISVQIVEIGAKSLNSCFEHKNEIKRLEKHDKKTQKSDVSNNEFDLLYFYLTAWFTENQKIRIYLFGFIFGFIKASKKSLYQEISTV